jgi:predicted signal transduction protein with EAL and GGDEF domain
VAGRLRSIMRSRDLLSRHGGDEFAILLGELHDKAEPFAIANRIAAAFERPFQVLGRMLYVTASIGVATNVYVADDAQTLLSSADAAQYQAKQSGRNRIEVFDVRMRDAIHTRLDSEQDLRAALAHGAIIPWYQPEIELTTGRMTGAEALARWDRPDRCVLDAGAFMALAEDAGLTYALDDAIISAAVVDRRQLHAAGLTPGDFRIWCNVGDEQITRKHPARRLAELLERTECSAAHLGIEVTERAALQDLAAVAAEGEAVRALGVHVALDDFGTGHSSLTLLRNLPIDRVKIDRSFVEGITRESRDRAIVAHLIALATDLGIEVVAEGIETREQAELLRSLGCNRAQGFLWSKALPLDELETSLRGQDPRASVVGRTLSA